MMHCKFKGSVKEIVEGGEVSVDKGAADRSIWNEGVGGVVRGTGWPSK